MPPNRHSSSSHSSRSNASRSSSRPSGSSFRSSGSHSSSGRFGRGPSSHSSSSHSSAPLFGGSRGSGTRAQSRPVSQPVGRPRINQPVGYLISGILQPTTYYGRRHDYVYYPEAWTDTASGTHYEKGYYDENGNYYDSVAFRKNGKYENVACHCPYCDSEHILTLDNTVGSTGKLQCPNCGAPLEIRSELDEIQPQAPENSNTHVYASEESLRPFYEQTQKKKRNTLRSILIAFLILIGIGNVFHRAGSRRYSDPVSQPDVQEIQLVNSADESRVYLAKTGPASYRETKSVPSDGKVLVWDDDAECFFDEESDCWLWYNTDVRPALWQYWYEDISSDFGEYGWMEHDLDGWYIEASEGDWIPLPEEYDTDELWYIES